MRRGGNSLLMVLALFLILAAGGVAYFYFLGGTGGGVGLGKAKLPPTAVPPQRVVHAVVDIKNGTVISTTTDVLKMAEIPGDEYLRDKGAYYVSLSDVLGQKALQNLQGGKPIRRSDIGPAGLADRIPVAAPGQESLRAFPIQVNTMTGVADLIQSGDFVDVMASFNQNVLTVRPGVPISVTTQLKNQGLGVGNNGTLWTNEQTQEGSTKVLLQDVEVLQVIHPAAIPAGTATAQPQAGPTAAPLQTPQPIQKPDNPAGIALQTGNWVVVVAVSEQESEVLRFALDRGIGISTLLRRNGDHTKDHTVGATLRILIDNFGLPVGSSLPAAQHPGPMQLPDVPTLPKEGVDRFAPFVPTAKP